MGITRLQPGDALVVVDAQVDFVSGSLAVPGAARVLPALRRCIAAFAALGLPVLQEYDGLPRRKRSEGKATWPGRKQVYRRYDAAGRIAADVLTLEDADPFGEPLLVPFMRGGEALDPPVSLGESREHLRRQLARLPAPLRALSPATPPRVEVSAELRALAARLDARH